tara:strand:- start:6507 stop:7484 length:978 start_codon:yes stop_codon:yes gene_type:complete
MKNRFLLLYCVLIILLISCKKDLPIIDTSVEVVEFPELNHDEPYFYGQTYNGRNNYITYIPGNIPMILSISHGGNIYPEEIPDRSYGTFVTDSNTIELGMSISNQFFQKFNVRPYMIINNLDRVKLDANRDKSEAAQGNIFAERSFDEFHNYIGVARDEIIDKFGIGILFDIHGHGINPDGFSDLRTWIGYLISSEDLDNTDEYINQNIQHKNTSISSLLNASDQSLADILRGPQSLGSFFEQYNYTALPSPESKSPLGMRYFTGGFNTFLYGTNQNYNFSAIQLEFPYPDLRDSSNSRNEFAIAFVELTQKYYLFHFGIDLFSL